MDKIEKDIEILMENIGWYWCEHCKDWHKEKIETSIIRTLIYIDNNPMNNPTCKYCGLLKSTVEETGSPCFENCTNLENLEKIGKTNILWILSREKRKRTRWFYQEAFEFREKMYEIGFEDGREEERKVWLKVSNELTK